MLKLGMSAAIVASAGTALAQSVESGNVVRMERLEKENAELRKRLDALEAMTQKEGIGAATPTNYVKALSGIEISGFVQASYFYDTSDPDDRKSNGYLWNTSENSFSINKVKLTLASRAVERSSDKWDAGFRSSFIWGEDAAALNTGGETQGLEDLREAFVELNVPIGEGLNVKAGQLISLLNYESGDGGAANANFSQGIQWWYTGNGPAAGVQLGYAFNDVVDFKVRAQNGLFSGAIDNNSGKTYLASVGLKPAKDLWFSFIGFGGEENPGFDLFGGSVLAGYQVTSALGLGLELDYFNFDTDAIGHADVWSVGGWLTYDFSPKLGLGFRADYIEDPDGFGIPGLAMAGRTGSAITSPDSDGNLGSVTLTLNYKPVPNIKIQPEVRYDYTGYEDGFDGQDARFMVGAGVSYLF